MANKIFEAFKSMFDFLRADSPYSTTRVAIMFTNTLFIPVFVSMWAWISYKRQLLQDIPNGVLWLLGGLLGIGLGKAVIEAAQDVFGKKDEVK